MPTQSITTLAPSPLLISLIRSKTSSSAKLTMSVAPAFRATAMRSGTVSIAMMRSAPSTLADWMANRPTGPEPQMATISPPSMPACSAA